MLILRSITALSAAALLTTTANAAELLTNSSFEGLAVSYVNLPGGSNVISGWTTTGEGVEWFASGVYGPAKDGNNLIDLAVYTSSGNPGGGIQQSFATVIGAQYEISYWGVTHTGAGRDGHGIVETYIDGTLFNTTEFVNLASTWTASTWQQVTVAFTATSTTTTLQFRNRQNANLHFAYIDGASVQQVTNAVPEPASWALMIGGMGLVGGAMRRRSRADFRIA